MRFYQRISKERMSRFVRDQSTIHLQFCPDCIETTFPGGSEDKFTHLAAVWNIRIINIPAENQKQPAERRTIYDTDRLRHGHNDK